MIKNNEHKSIILKLFKVLSAKDNHLTTRKFTEVIQFHFIDYQDANFEDLELSLASLIYSE